MKNRWLSAVILGLLGISTLGCGGPAEVEVDPVESKQKEEEITRDMEKAMQEQMGGGAAPSQ